jgi:putative phage-type endonuclease
MTRQTITPTDRDHWLALRAQDLTSTDVAALFGMSPYRTKFELWHEKRSGTPTPVTQNARMTWGSRLERSIAEGIAEDNGWTIRHFSEYMRDPELRIGSSFDFRIMSEPNAYSETSPNVASNGFCPPDTQTDAILEIKTVDALAFRNGWTVTDDFIEAPAHIELQVQHQLLVSGLSVAYIGVLIGGNDVRILQRKADDGVHAAIRAKAAEFWRSIADNTPPDPVMPADAAAVIRLNSYAEPGRLRDARGDEVIASAIADYARIGREIEDLQAIRDSRKAEILTLVGDAEKVLADGFTISAGMVADSPGTLVTADMVGQYVGGRRGYRNFRVTSKK